MGNNFGVIIVCCRADFSYAKGTVASVRRFMPGVPICLLIDGPFNPKSFVKRYGLDIINKPLIRDSFLKAHAHGAGLTKMIALWESPYEHFLLLDSDTVLWGDIRGLADFTKFDYVVDTGNQSTPDIMNLYIFDPKLIEIYQPDFNHAGQNYFCNGVFFGARGLIPIEEFQRFIEKESELHLFRCRDQGWFNFIIHYGKQTGLLRVDQKNLQYIVCDHSREETRLKFGSAPPAHVTDPTVIHWAGVANPLWTRRRETCAEAMFYFRRQLLADAGLRFVAAQNAYMWCEEWIAAWPRATRNKLFSLTGMCCSFAKAALRLCLGDSRGEKAIRLLRRLRS